MGEYRQELMTLMKRDDLGNKRKNDSWVIYSNIESLHRVKVCVDCAAPNPQWATIPYAVFICLSVRGRWLLEGFLA
jgi:Putative GTPase activating protein for Arf